MRDIDSILLKLKDSIENGSFDTIETDKIELKDLSSGEKWTELYKTICAFLNTKGGIVIIGINENTKNKKYKLTGYDSNNEHKLKDIVQKFHNENGLTLDLTDYIRPDSIEVNQFLDKQICLIFVEKLPDDLKYVYFEKIAYERRITGDHPIHKDKIIKQNELKEELRSSIELEFVPNSNLDDLDVDKLNEFIIRLNTDKRVETLKADIQSSIPFLTRKKMIRNLNPTLLGLLVCGKHIFDFIGGKCELDCYFESGKEIAADQKIYHDNVITLMENGWAYTFSKIGTGISAERGGKAIYEYPEEIIRETINNALAHRDYKSTRFSMIRIRNNEYIEIRNPGKFRQEQIFFSENPDKIRRIIPIPKAINSNLADILKAYKRWEGRGIGMASLTNFALNNFIDVPYYRIYNNEIGLFIPKGKVLDEKSILWLNSFKKYILQKTKGKELNEDQQTVLSYFYKSELLNNVEKYTVNLTPDNNHFETLGFLEKYGLVNKLEQSTIELQVYRIDPVLKILDFSREVRIIFGSHYDNLNVDYKEVLESIYQINKYGQDEGVSASLIGNHLYYRNNSSVNLDLKSFGNFKRKIRIIINNLEKAKLIVRKQQNKPDYKINEEFKRIPSIFDEVLN